MFISCYILNCLFLFWLILLSTLKKKSLLFLKKQSLHCGLLCNGRPIESSGLKVGNKFTCNGKLSGVKGKLEYYNVTALDFIWAQYVELKLLSVNLATDA